MFDVVVALAYRQRVVIVTRYWLGWSEEEIARALSCSARDSELPLSADGDHQAVQVAWLDAMSR